MNRAGALPTTRCVCPVLWTPRDASARTTLHTETRSWETAKRSEREPKCFATAECSQEEQGACGRLFQGASGIQRNAQGGHEDDKLPFRLIGSSELCFSSCRVWSAAAVTRQLQQSTFRYGAEQYTPQILKEDAETYFCSVRRRRKPTDARWGSGAHNESLDQKSLLPETWNRKSRWLQRNITKHFEQLTCECCFALAIECNSCRQAKRFVTLARFAQGHRRPEQWNARVQNTCLDGNSSLHAQHQCDINGASGCFALQHSLYCRKMGQTLDKVKLRTHRHSILGPLPPP